MDNDSKKRRTRYLAVSIVFFTAAAVFALFAAGYKLKRLRALNNQTALRDEVSRELEGPKEKQFNGIVIPDRGIDWAALKTLNPDIIGYIYIPGTRIDGPVLKHPSDRDFYLTHAVDGSDDEDGSFCADDTWNGFSSYNTVIRARSAGNGSGFSTLSFLEDKDFFERSPYIFLYTPSKTFILEIFSAYHCKEEEILTDFSPGEDFTAYLDSIFATKDLNANFRRETMVRLDDNARILSCVALSEDGDEGDYAVQAVLLNTEE